MEVPIDTSGGFSYVVFMAKKSPVKKNRTKHLLLLLIILLILWVLTILFAPSEETYRFTGEATVIPDLELPYYEEGAIVVSHPGYTLRYEEEHEQPSWVAYQLTRADLYGEANRKDNFRADPSIPTGSATLDDYRSSGYDRGHLIPAADLVRSDEAMSGSFFMSNMSPQEPQFNRGIWATLEAVVRNFAETDRSIYVVTGPVLTDGPYKTIGKNEVSVPNSYYKVILDYEEPLLKAIGFVLPNEGSKADVSEFAMSVRDVEELTGIDFFYRLPDSIEEELETAYDLELWDLTPFQATTKAKAAYLESGEEPATLVATEEETSFYTVILDSFNHILYIIRKESISLLEDAVGKQTLKQFAPFLY